MISRSFSSAGEAKKPGERRRGAKNDSGDSSGDLGLRSHAARHSEFQRSILGVVVRVVVVTMMVFASGECGACNNQQQEGGENELLHAMQISTDSYWNCAGEVTRIKSGTVQSRTKNSSIYQVLPEPTESIHFGRLSLSNLLLSHGTALLTTGKTLACREESLRGVHW